METVITVLENQLINVNGIILTPEDFGFGGYYAMFIKRNVGFYPGATIVQKKQGRPRTSNKVQKTLRIEKKHVNDLNILVNGLNISDRIVAKINEGQEPDVKPYTINDISIGLIKFWTNELTK